MSNTNILRVIKELCAERGIRVKTGVELDGRVWVSHVHDDIEATFSFSSFVPGSRLIDGGDLLALVNFFFSFANNLTAFAGGGAAGAVILSKANNVFTVVANANDSCMLPPSGNFPVGAVVTITNHGAQTLAVFGNTNPGPGLPADLVASNVASAGAASVTQAATKVANYELIQPGTVTPPVAALWKQFLSG